MSLSYYHENNCCIDNSANECAAFANEFYTINRLIFFLFYFKSFLFNLPMIKVRVIMFLKINKRIVCGRKLIEINKSTNVIFKLFLCSNKNKKKNIHKNVLKLMLNSNHATLCLLKSKNNLMNTYFHALTSKE